jgi:hypothetical protein
VTEKSGKMAKILMPIYRQEPFFDRATKSQTCSKHKKAYKSNHSVSHWMKFIDEISMGIGRKVPILTEGKGGLCQVVVRKSWRKFSKITELFRSNYLKGRQLCTPSLSLASVFGEMYEVASCISSHCTYRTNSS